MHICNIVMMLYIYIHILYNCITRQIDEWIDGLMDDTDVGLYRSLQHRSPRQWTLAVPLKSSDKKIVGCCSSISAMAVAVLALTSAR